ncbi:N-acetylmuramic acid 6-phosphate phosphatase [Ralstonia condita]|uniref:N-acetylmuramic acid 6-phosphate phosphatase n=1 Tax=Ralstonia condita TaxID=3058600 RepID=A0ABM9JHJ4_9RALS|nr:HAD-IA family hydrolase [Ralstonia sp. LMG 7141]CAJ0793497.1 N-acetylmuramic acid 6-phosphate phosphatase [Ralstonia sp. LMG 7141]
MMVRKFPNPLGAVLFDLDGTLADTAPDLAAAANKVRTDRGLEPLAYEALRPVASHGARGLIGVAFGVGPQDAEFESLRLAFLANYAAEICVRTRLFPGMTHVLAELGRAGIPWGIVTNKSARLTMPLVAQLAFPVAPACVVAGDTTPHAKPHPAPLLHAAQSIGIDARQIVYVGDDLRDIEAGRAAGMPTIAASYGYCGNGPAPEAWQADALIAGAAELVPLLLESQRV